MSSYFSWRDLFIVYWWTICSAALSRGLQKSSQTSHCFFTFYDDV